MSRLLIVVRSGLATGFELAGVDACGVEDVETAQELISGWLDTGETGLLAIDDGLLARMEPAFVKRLEDAGSLPYLAIPGGEALGPGASRMYHVAELIRRAIGLRITFRGEGTKAENE